jgi:hypothetical protein
MLSAGIGTRSALIAELVNKGIVVEVLAQDPATAVDKADAQRFPKSVEDLLMLVRDPRLYSLVELRCYVGLAGLRTLVGYDSNGKVLLLQVGWYTYRNRGTTLGGVVNPTIVAAPDSAAGQRLLAFAEAEFDRCSLEAGPNIIGSIGRQAD